MKDLPSLSPDHLNKPGREKYERPLAELLEINVERGFGATSGEVDETPGGGVGDFEQGESW